MSFVVSNDSGELIFKMLIILWWAFVHYNCSTWTADSLTKYKEFPILFPVTLQIQNQKSKLEKIDPKTEGNIKFLHFV